LDAHFSTRPTAEWLTRLEAADIFCAPVLNYSEITSHEQAKANGYIVETEHPRAGPTRVIACPIQFRSTPASSDRPEPGLGEHTDEVLAQFGYTQEEISSLREEGVVG